VCRDQINHCRHTTYWGKVHEHLQVGPDKQHISVEQWCKDIWDDNIERHLGNKLKRDTELYLEKNKNEEPMFSMQNMTAMLNYSVYQVLTARKSTNDPAKQYTFDGFDWLDKCLI
jgi:hypothetical protein